MSVSILVAPAPGSLDRSHPVHETAAQTGRERAGVVGRRMFGVWTARMRVRNGVGPDGNKVFHARLKREGVVLFWRGNGGGESNGRSVNLCPMKWVRTEFWA
jgi:hypothetical protein